MKIHNDDTMLLTILWNYFAYYEYHIYIFILIHESDRISVGYVCLWEGKYYGSKFLHLFNSCCDMVSRSSEVSLSRFNDIKMKNFKDNKGCWNVAIQGINRSKTSTYQELCIYPKREFIIYDWYWYMEYTCAIEPSEEKFIFPEFVKTVFKSGYYIINSKVSHMMQKVYERFYCIVLQYRKIE